MNAPIVKPGLHHGLWSLWEIMKPFDAALFMKFMEAAGMTRTLVDRFPAIGDFSLREVGDGRWAKDWLTLMDLYERPCEELGLDASLATIRKLRSALSTSNPLSTEINPLTIEFRWAIT
jgi:hypothetical protein